MTKSTNYIYGISPSEFAHLPYSEALQFKYNAAKSLVKELYSEHYSSRDTERINAAYDAIGFNRKLIHELTVPQTN